MAHHEDERTTLDGVLNMLVENGLDGDRKTLFKATGSESIPESYEERMGPAFIALQDVVQRWQALHARDDRPEDRASPSPPDEDALKMLKALGYVE